MRALVTAEITEDGVRRLEALGYEVTRAGWGIDRQVLDESAFASAAAGCALVLTEIEVVGPTLVAAVPELRLVGTARGGPVNVDATACHARGIPVLFTPGRNADSVADYVVGLLLSATRGIGAAERHLRGTGWHVGDELPYLHFRGPELSRLRVGIVGMGAIGRRVAQRLSDGFGCAVAFYDPQVDGSVALDDLLAGSDALSLHCPRSAATIGLVGARELALMPSASYVVNTAGGGIVDETALVDALVSGRLAGAALDVFASEPLPRDSLLLTAPGLVLTPHLAGAADDVVRHHTEMLVGDVERFHRGEPLVHALWPPTS